MTEGSAKTLRELHLQLIDQLELDILPKNTHSQMVNSELASVYNSISWRITRPLRAANACINGFGVPTNKIRFLIGAFRSTLRTEGLVSALSKSKKYMGKQKKADFQPALKIPKSKEEKHPPANEVFKASIALICESNSSPVLQVQSCTEGRDVENARRFNPYY